MRMRGVTKSYSLLILIVSFQAVVLPLNAQSDKLDTLEQKALELEEAGKFAEAIPLAMKVMEGTRSLYGEESLNYANSMSFLAELYRSQNRFSSAAELMERVLAFWEKLNPNHLVLRTLLLDLAVLYENLGRYAEAEPLYIRYISFAEKFYGPDHRIVGSSLNYLAELYETLGRFDEAEILFKRQLAMLEKALGPDHHSIGSILSRLASLYTSQERYALAERLYKRSLTIQKKENGTDNSDVAILLNNIAEIYRSQGRLTESAELYKQSLSIMEKLIGDEEEYLGIALYLANFYMTQERFDEAELALKRYLDIKEKFLGHHHPDVGDGLHHLASLYELQGRYVDAEAIYKQSLAIMEKAFDAKHSEVSTAHFHLAYLFESQKKYDLAYIHYKKSNAISIKRINLIDKQIGKGLTINKQKKSSENRWSFIRQVSTAHALDMDKPERDQKLKFESFIGLQWAHGSDAAKALIQMASRFGSDNQALKTIVRDQQDITLQWQKLDKQLIAAISEPNDQRDPKIENQLRKDLQKIESKLARTNIQLTNEFPQYTALVNPKPLSFDEVKRHLNANEALVSFLLGEKTSFVFVVTKNDDPAWFKLPVGYQEIREEVRTLRCGLDAAAWNSEGKTKRCQKLLNLSISYKDYKSGIPLPYHLGKSHELYDGLFGQFEDLIKDKKLLVVADDALTSLPFQVLLTEKPKRDITNDDEAYRGVSWFGKKHSITMLPSVASLKALRGIDKQNIEAANPFVGFGNPLLTGRNGNDRRAFDKQNCTNIKVRDDLITVSSLPSLGASFRGTLANVDKLKKQSPLPETTDELCAVAKSLNVPETEIYLGAKATETVLKALNKTRKLKDYRYVHFATHGLVSGELKFQAEPALILTPPDKATEADDGLLTASEVANLKLNADWVILSACNTAAGEEIGAEPYSGLARAFFYAGAKALLVSHWAVASKPTVKLITGAFDALESNPKIGRSEAMRQSMLALMKDDPHPSVWAPFVVVGEGNK